MKKILPFVLSLFVLIMLFAPALSFAQGAAGSATAKSCVPVARGIGDYICKIGDILKSIIPLIVLLGVVYFVWGVVQYMIGGGEEAKTAGRDKIIYGLIGFVIIASMWGIVGLVVNTFGFTDAQLVALNIAPAPSVSVIAPSGEAGACDAILAGKTKLQHVLSYVTCLLGASVIPFIFALAVVMFIWGVVQFFILGGGEEEKRTQGKQFMIWGIIALVVMISVWALVAIVGDTFGLGGGVLPSVKP